ncbi:MAG: pyroglutamyl-peptidase I [Thermofilaceae archaeon]|nr:pyroglutamyl-peptidase I [Thermofilaceae archaeon]MCX8179774.1 pyroglutamyl-peptidase I [Thermofilaceae archaeon]MDW8004301.1 pyroglutamyl-peptidase I [Thermofilaceae archaeon]
MLKILVTGFEPFGGESVNPSSLAAEQAARVLSEKLGTSVVHAILPVSFKRTREVVRELVAKVEPDIAVGLGLSGGIAHVAVERVALNFIDARSPDNDGVTIYDEPIEPDGPLAYLSTLPVKLIVKRLRELGIPAAVSYSAGTFLCNLVFYELLHLRALTGVPKKAGFLHIPYLPSQAVSKRSWSGYAPSMPLEYVVKAVATAVETTVERMELGDEKIPL